VTPHCNLFAAVLFSSCIYIESKLYFVNTLAAMIIVVTTVIRDSGQQSDLPPMK
jgi:hypothetical protein